VAETFSLLLMPPRAAVVEAADARFRAMLAAGALAEVARLLEAAVPEDAPAMQALGARDLADHLKGRIGLAEASRRAQAATRRYAKRQATWFRHQFHSMLTLDSRYTGQAREAVVSRLETFLKAGFLMEGS
jgi:tRNA dimethylallyltransferase